MESDFYNVNSILGFTSMLTVLCLKTIMFWVFPTASKISPARTICFILTTLNSEQHPCKHVIFYKDGALEKSADVTNLLVDDFIIAMETTGFDASWINGNNE